MLLRPSPFFLLFLTSCLIVNDSVDYSRTDPREIGKRGHFRSARSPARSLAGRGSETISRDYLGRARGYPSENIPKIYSKEILTIFAVFQEYPETLEMEIFSFSFSVLLSGEVAERVSAAGVVEARGGERTTRMTRVRVLLARERLSTETPVAIFAISGPRVSRHASASAIDPLS